jgi:hypothetical protein
MVVVHAVHDVLRAHRCARKGEVMQLGQSRDVPRVEFAAGRITRERRLVSWGVAM